MQRPFYCAPDSPDYSTLDPISQLNRTDADVLLISFANNAWYNGLVTDPWFTATNLSHDVAFLREGYVANQVQT